MERAVRKIALYARVSTKNKGQDPENQLHILREFAQAQGWKIAHEYVDHVSGKSSDRAQWVVRNSSPSCGIRASAAKGLASFGITKPPAVTFSGSLVADTWKAGRSPFRCRPAPPRSVYGL